MALRNEILALEDQLNAVAGSYQPLMLLGEAGTAKEQIARAVYLRSPRTRSPFVTVDCTVASDREWDFLFDHYASPHQQWRSVPLSPHP